MTTSDDKYIIPDEDEGQGSSSGEGGRSTGGAAGRVHFRYKDAMSLEPRDDALSPTETKRLLAVHEDLHKGRVDKQKLARKERKALKEGRVDPTKTHGARAGYGSGAGGRYSPYKSHRIANTAQFSHTDPQVVGIPNKNRSQTNEERRNKLEENRLELENRNELRYQNAPRFNPKPRPF